MSDLKSSTISSENQLNNFDDALPSEGAPLQRRALADVQGLTSLQRDLDNYTPVVQKDEQFEEFRREQALRSNAGLSSVQFSPMRTKIIDIDQTTGEVKANRYIALREREKGPVITTYAPEVSTRSVVKDSRLIWRDGGNVFTVKRAGVRRVHDRDAAEPLLKVSPCDQKIVNRGGNDTSPAPVFSRPSRRRFMRQLASVRCDTYPVFITLTYPDHFPESPKDWKRHLDNFGKRFVRKFGRGFAWRMELKRRKSGENKGKIAPHFHLLTWNVAFGILLEWVPQNWYEVVGSGDEKHLRAGTRVEKVRTVRGVMWYSSKYLAKVEKDDLEDCPSVGRLWGFVGRDLIPFADELEEAISERDAVKLIRWMRKAAKIPGRDYQSLTIFGDGRQWKRCIELLC